MAKKKIYDREYPCEEILHSIESSEDTTAFFVYSLSGVGKSSVCTKIANILNKKNDKKVIRITSPQENENVLNGAFLRLIFKYIQRFYEKEYIESSSKNKKEYRKYLFSTFLSKNETFLSVLQCFFDNTANILSVERKSPYFLIYVVKAIIDYILLKCGVIKKINSEGLQDNKIMSNYIRHVLGAGNIVLNIDNVQNFDDLSLEYFISCLVDTKDINNFLLLEFTLSEDNSNYENMQNIMRKFRNANISTASLKLDNLQTTDVIKIANEHCSNKDDFFDVAIRNTYEKVCKGNIKKIEDFASIYSENISLDKDPTYGRIDRLSANQKYILAVIIINNAVIKTKTLKYIIENSNKDFMLDFDADVISFCNAGNFIEQTNNEIRIIHSNTIDVWQKNIHIFKKYELSAYRNCEMIYKRILHNNLFNTLSKKECILLLFQLYNKYEISKIASILYRINEIIYDFLSAEDLRKYLKKLVEYTDDTESTVKFLYNIIDICIKYQLYDVEGFCLKKIKYIKKENLSERYYLYQYIKMFQGEEYEDLLELIDSNKQHNFSKQFESYGILFEIVVNRAMNNDKKYSQLVFFANNNSNLRESIHYAYFLRLAEAYDKRNIAIPKVEKSVALFQKANLPIQAAKSQVSLAFLYAITGRVNDAKRILDISEKILIKNAENRYVFFINKACINLLNEKYTNETWNLLDEAEKYTQMKFDCIAIIINKIIWCIENLNFKQGIYLQNKGLELLDTESDKHIHAIFYYNCYLLNKASNNLEKEKYFYKLAYVNRKYCETLKARIEGKAEVEDNTTFLLSKPWHVCFVSYWYFDYLGDLD